jgi:hypothetical protein
MLSQNRVPIPPAWKSGAQLNIFDHSTLVNGQEGGFEIALEFGFEAAGGLGGGQRVDDVQGGGEQDLVRSQTGSMAQGASRVRFAHHAAPGMMGIMPGTGLCRAV